MRKQFIRRVLALVLSVSFLFSLTVSSSAAKHDVSKNEKKLLSTTKTSEYEMLNQLKSQSVEELKKKGLSESEIKDIKDFDYISELKKRAAKYNNKDLSSIGYSTNEINLLRDSNTTDSQLVAMSAVLTLDVWEYGHFYTSTLSEVYLETNYEWDLWPVFTGTDIVAVAWSNGMYCQVNNQQAYDTYCDVNYYDIGKIYRGASVLTVIADVTVGAHVNIPLRKRIGNYETCALNGRIQTYITKKAAVPEIAVKSSYGHSTVTLTPTVAITGAPSISFSGSMITAGEDSMYIDLTVPY